ncbi:MAG: 30S ribosomal protein S5 [Holosporales bacterium]|jgi:small subunit ribosomal protein S5|nr:30S ribosomal protein S5 [Holosporales bacterium]
MSRVETSEGDNKTAYTEKLVSVNRIAKVVKGGKRFSFSALVIVGDGHGRVGFGTGKAREVPDAVKKASEQARQRMVRVPLRESRTIHHDVTGRFGAGLVVLRTAPAGTGIIAGGAMRAIFESLGIQDVVSKCVGSTNPHNMVRSTFSALCATASPRSVASRRGKNVGEIISKRGDAQGTKGSVRG